MFPFKIVQFLLSSFQVRFSSRFLSSGHVVEDWVNQTRYQIRQAKRKWGLAHKRTNDVPLLQVETVQVFQRVLGLRMRAI